MDCARLLWGQFKGR